MKKSRPWKGVRSSGAPESGRACVPVPRGSRSRTSAVPAAVPSETHSSRPCVPSSAENHTRPPKAARCSGREEKSGSPNAPGSTVLMFLTNRVPAEVPSVTHSSRSPARVAAKKSCVPTAVSPSGSLPAPPGSMSATRLVPAAVPSVRHSSRPCVASPAAK